MFVWPFVVVIALVLAAFVVPLVVGFVVFAVGVFVQLPDTTYVLVALTLFQFGWFVTVGLLYLRSRDYSWDDVVSYLGVGMPSLRDIGLILVTWFAMLLAAMVVAYLITEFLPTLLGVEQAPEPAENPITGVVEENTWIVPAAVLFMFAVVGPAEETLFRGIVQNRLRERFTRVPAVLAASALFAVVHVAALAGQGDAVAIAMSVTILFVPSLGFGFIYEYTGNIVVPALLHGFHNSVIVLLVAGSAVADFDPESAALLSEGLAALPV